MKIDIQLVAEGSKITMAGKTACGWCRFKLGRPCHVAIFRDIGPQTRQVLSLLPNKNLVKLEKSIGRCTGNHGIWVRGRVTEYRGRNFLSIDSFRLSRRKTARY